MALQFAIVAMGAVLRGIGDMKMPTLITVVTVIVNIILAPVLTVGWLTGHAFGVRGRRHGVAHCHRRRGRGVRRLFPPAVESAPLPPGPLAPADSRCGNRCSALACRQAGSSR